MSKKIKNKGLQCRFNFPKPLKVKTELIWDEKKNCYNFESERNDELMNNYNKFMLRQWRGNIDIQPIISINAVLNYISKYISKAETKSKTFIDTLKTLIKNDKISSIKNLISKILNKSICDHDYSDQEIVYLAMSYPLVRSSRIFKTINIDNENLITLFKEVDGVKMNQLNKNENPINNYCNRPENFENYTFSEFYKNVYKYKGVFKVTDKELL